MIDDQSGDIMKFYTNVCTNKNNILVRGIEDGKPFKEIVKYRPDLFISCAEEGVYHTLDGSSVKKISFDDMTAARQFVNLNKNTAGMEIYGLTDYPYSFIYHNYSGVIEFDASLISVVAFDIEVNDTNGFPDPLEANEPITAITMARDGKKAIFGCKDYTQTRKGDQYFKCVDEAALLKTFLEIWNSVQFQPMAITGWNIEFFDIPYLVNRIKKILGEEAACKLSPWKIIRPYEVKSVGGRINHSYLFEGVATLDYMSLYKKFTYKIQESYRLDYIAFVELGERKLDYSEYSNLSSLYEQDFEKFISYNIRDVELIEMLDDKLKLIELVFTMSYDAKINYKDCLGTVKQWDTIIHNYLMDRRIVVPLSFGNRNDDFSLIGGYVKEPKLGMSKWIMSFDLNSLYPSLIQHYNIGPDTFVAKRKIAPIEKLLNREPLNNMQAEYSYAANGCIYRKNKQSFLSVLMEKMYVDRVKYKKEMVAAKKELEVVKSKIKNKSGNAQTIGEELRDFKNAKKQLEKTISRLNNLQMAKKIQLNSAYGALGNKYFRWFDIRHAEAITVSGQLAIRWVEKAINKYLNDLLKTNEDYIIASDTDSVYITLEKLVSKVFQNESDQIKIVKFLDKIGREKIEPVIDAAYADMSSYLNSYSQTMKMKRESIANKGIWKAKKMYILNIWDSEGVTYDSPELKMVGIEAVKSSTPSACRDNIKKAIKIIMDGSEKDVQKFIADFRKKYETLPIDEISYPRGMNNINKWVDEFGDGHLSRTPIHVRAAITYNRLLTEFKIENKYQAAKSGDKIKYCYLLTPNPARSNVIAYINMMPPEFNLEPYIDYDLQFQKSFIEPLDSILKTINYKPEKTATLESFFNEGETE